MDVNNGEVEIRVTVQPAQADGRLRVTVKTTEGRKRLHVEDSSSPEKKPKVEVKEEKNSSDGG